MQQSYRPTRLFAPAFAIFLATSASAQEAPIPAPSRAPSADKSSYTLFNPTPRELMRELSTDRPDTTESPYTVDAGHFQLELSFIDYSYDDTDGVTTKSLAIAPMLLKVGLTNNIDLALGLDPYTRIRTNDGASTTTADGFGDTILRLKANLWGNDGGDTAFAVMPYIKLPTADDDLGNDDVEGGIILPLGLSLPHDFSMGLMAEFDFLRDQADEGYVVDFVHTATIGRTLIGDLSGYVEFAGFYNLNADADYRAFFDAGLTYGLTPDIQLDAGLRVGLTEAADDFGVFTGIALRY